MILYFSPYTIKWRDTILILYCYEPEAMLKIYTLVKGFGSNRI